MAEHSLSDVQQRFTARLRDPDNQPEPFPDPAQGLRIYENAVFHNASGLIEGGFPCLKEILDESFWDELIRDFLKQHHSSAPLFTEVAAEFYTYLTETRNQSADPDYLQELALYDLVRTGLEIDTTETDSSELETDADLMDGYPVINPVMRALVFHWPVHLIADQGEALPRLEQPIYLAVYRDADYKVAYLNINPVSARLIDLMRTEPGRTGHHYLMQLAEELQHPDPEQLLLAGAELLQDFCATGLLLGAKSPDSTHVEK